MSSDIETHRKKLKQIFTYIKMYIFHVLEDLSPDDLTWRPDNTKARTIISYINHLMNTEIYWLKALDTSTYDYVRRDNSLNEIISLFEKVEKHYLRLIDEATVDDLQIRRTIYEEKDGEIISVKQKGTLAWTVLRLALHTLGHISHINHIRYSLGKPPKEGGDYWWTYTEIMIGLFDIS
ncbi:MAG: DinB family protein [Candidatus Heimdallarchaeota archaeon]|nr:MAG: DinB family protein [Candidatus Heimdallarchaeota archaeon]